jgi:intracellular sulfur oxidation DsrE/DsrF family protein
MPPFLSEPPALVFEVVIYCWIFLSPAPKLVRYGVLSYAINTALRAMAFEGNLALAARVVSAAVAAVLLMVWAYQVSNRPRNQGAQAAR